MLQRVFTRVSKPAARYSDRGSAQEHCSACRFFMSGGDCARVLGRVLPQGWCKYFSQEAVQRWNPLWQMAGIPAPPGATLDLSFMNPGTLDPRITFTRASTATYTNYAGVMQTAAANTPRWDYNPASHVLNGLLIEEARTNLVVASSNFTGNWSFPAGGGTLTPNTTIAPDGTMTASTITKIVAGESVMRNTLAVPATNVTYCLTLFVKQGTSPYTNIAPSFGGGTSFPTVCVRWSDLALDSRTGGNAAAGYGILPAGNGWYRLWIALPNVGSSSALLFDVRAAGSGTPGFGDGSELGTVFIWGADVEQGAFPTSYIPTTAAAVTRAYDYCTMSPANMAGWFASPGGSWMAEFINIDTDMTARNPRIIAQAASSGVTQMWEAAGSRVLSQYDGAEVDAPATVTANAIARGASSYTSGTGKVCLNGGAVGTGTMSTGYGACVGSGIAFFATGAGTASESMVGYLRRVRYWPRVLSNAEMQQVTT